MIVTPPFNSAVLNTLWANIALLAFRDQVLDSVAVQKMVDGGVDEYEDETGIDTGASSGQAYDSTNDLYYPALTPLNQYPPAQNSTYVKATSNYGAGYAPEYITDPAKSLTGSFTNNSWGSAGTTNQRFHIDLGVGKVVKQIYYEPYHDSGNAGSVNAAPKNFTLWGTNDAGAFADLVYSHDTNWTQITTASSQMVQHVAANQADPKYIAVTNTVAYRYYAFKFADNWGNAAIIGLRRLVLQSDPANMTLMSQIFTANAQASKARVILFQENVDAITLNTDLIASVSRDGGTTWTACVLASLGTYETGKNILAGIVDISGQPAGTSMKYKIDTANAKNTKIHGTGLLWQ